MDSPSDGKFPLNPGPKGEKDKECENDGDGDEGAQAISDRRAESERPIGLKTFQQVRCGHEDEAPWKNGYERFLQMPDEEESTNSANRGKRVVLSLTKVADRRLRPKWHPEILSKSQVSGKHLLPVWVNGGWRNGNVWVDGEKTTSSARLFEMWLAKLVTVL